VTGYRDNTNSGGSSLALGKIGWKCLKLIICRILSKIALIAHMELRMDYSNINTERKEKRGGKV
jgi:hypothetical protein